MTVATSQEAALVPAADPLTSALQDGRRACAGLVDLSQPPLNVMREDRGLCAKDKWLKPFY